MLQDKTRKCLFKELFERRLSSTFSPRTKYVVVVLTLMATENLKREKNSFEKCIYTHPHIFFSLSLSLFISLFLFISLSLSLSFFLPLLLNLYLFYTHTHTHFVATHPHSHPYSLTLFLSNFLSHSLSL